MMKSYKLTDIISELKNQSVEFPNFENLLTYYSNDDLKHVIGNLNTGINIEIDDPSMLSKFHVATDMFWPQISQLIYKTGSLYWFLQLLNPNATTTPFGKVKAPNHIKYVPNILKVLRDNVS